MTVAYRVWRWRVKRYLADGYTIYWDNCIMPIAVKRASHIPLAVTRVTHESL